GYGGYYGYGYGWPFYPYYYGSYGYRYGYGYPYEWGYRYRRAYSEPLGAFDLDVKPKKTEVYLNGHFIGTASKYDGYPSLLWLPEGEHQLVFFKPGFMTEVREVEALPGVRLDFELDMRPGESTPVKEVAIEAKTAPVPERRPYVGGRSVRATPPPADRDAPSAAGEPDVLDTRGEPGRLSLRVAPEDAAVYLDGRFLGTGGEMAALHAGLLVDAGEHVLSVMQPGRETSVDFSVESGEEKELTVDLDEL
ncbi:MAG: hypothetical protein OES47_14770, partial [Acidobacteriota bacterium]|nr:hypothetical protein [Acidobacteriota bacterium]